MFQDTCPLLLATDHGTTRTLFRPPTRRRRPDITGRRRTSRCNARECRAKASKSLNPGTDYSLQVELNGAEVTVFVGGIETLKHTFNQTDDPVFAQVQNGPAIANEDAVAGGDSGRNRAGRRDG